MTCHPEPPFDGAQGRLRRRGIPILLGGFLAALGMTGIAHAQSLQQNSERLVAHALTNSRAYETLSYLTDNIGPRLSGTRNAALAVKWTTERFRAWGIPVRQEKIMVPRWIRGAERARLVSHNDQKIVLTTLGGSVATPADGITAEVVEVSSFDELKALGRSKVAGKIVFYYNPMDLSLVRAGRAFEAYSKAVEFRSKGADNASDLGALAVVIRSVDSQSLRSPHTGALRYERTRKIPAAAMSAEDAMLIHRLIGKGEKVRMHLVLTPRTLSDVESANVVAEITGSQNPEQIVLIGGHLDSWDLGTGAIDNGSGVAMVMETMRLLKELNIQPRRTVRCVLFMNEENGLRGGRGYWSAHQREMGRHIAAIESDAGSAKPVGFGTTLQGPSLAYLQSQLGVLQRIGPLRFELRESTGADTSNVVKGGVPGFGLLTESTQYFDYHHSAADTLDKIDPNDLAANSAAIAALTYVIADSPRSLR